MCQHLTAGRDLVASSKQQQQRGKQCHQTEVTHRCCGCKQVVLVKLVKRMHDHRSPRRSVSDAEGMSRECTKPLHKTKKLARIEETRTGEVWQVDTKMLIGKLSCDATARSAIQ